MRRFLNTRILGLFALFLGLFTFSASAATYYVDINSPNPTPPYTSWATASTDIQSAINVSAPGDFILVTNGVYQTGGETVNGYALTNRVAIIQPITVQSVNGPAVTFIQGYQVPGTINGSNAVRCAYLTNNATLIGFTLSGGATINTFNSNITYGGGVWCQSNSGILSNCIITANAASQNGGGVYLGTLFNCAISNNFADEYGGGAYESYMVDCMVISNTAGSDGGGVYNSDLTNCAIANNSSLYESQGGGAYAGNLVNCTIVGNSAWSAGGTIYANLVNCINYYNTASFSYNNYSGGSFSYCCTTPSPGGTANITNQPLFASTFDISSSSPCRGAGNAAAASGVDINGNPWANPPSMGCEEPYPGSMFGNIGISITTQWTNVPVGYPMNLQANITGLVNNSVWNFGDGTVVSNQPYISHTWSAVGNYSVVLTAYNDSYPNGQSATNLIEVYQPTVFYVASNQVPVAPYDSWAKAATSIQAAINVSIPGSLILVSNGVYNVGSQNSPDGGTNRVTLTQPLTLQSVNGAAATTIIGGNAVRCIYLPNGAILNGFTLTGGNNAVGGGVYCSSTNSTITNCIITSCSARSDGGGACSGTFYNCSLTYNSSTYGGGAFGGIFYNCTIANNSATYEGGGIYSESGYPVTLENCIIVSNSANSYGGGVFNLPVAFFPPFIDCLSNCYITNCVISYNSAQYSGSGTVAAYLDNCTVNSNKIAYIAAAAGYLVGCTLIGNQGVAASPNGGDLFNGTWEVLSNCTLIANGAGADGCSLYGCTLLQNNGEGGALYSTLVNCLISSNTTPESGGGAYQSALTNCSLAFNQATYGGGADDCTLVNCSLVANAAGQSGGGGGAAGSTLNNCLILQNIATNEGGGVMSCSLNNCLIISNVASLYQNGPACGGGAYSSTLTNCVLVANIGTNGGGAYLSELVNCTITENTAVLGGGTLNCTNYNSILYYNTGGDYSPSTPQYPLNYCCTALMPTNGFRNITSPPLFVNPSDGDYHLQSTSPCINSGNNAYVALATDLDGNPRIVGGTVDIGAYEYQSPTSVISYAWLQQYGLPTDGTVDFTNFNGAAFNVYQDWVAGLNPTNSSSVLAMLTPITTNTASGVTVTWQSVTNILYNLQRSTNLFALPVFTTIQSNIVGQANTTSYTDTSATNNVPYFYRVTVLAP